jgi:hypothetical protein
MIIKGTFETFNEICRLFCTSISKIWDLNVIINTFEIEN